MKKNKRPFYSLLILVLVSLACASPIGDAPSSPDHVATIVAGTLQALTPGAPAELTPEPEPTPVSLLPHSFYYLGTDATGLSQVFRIERDGITQRQITVEPLTVDSYDVSLVDGSVAYISNNQLFMIDADGSGRRLLVDGVLWT